MLSYFIVIIINLIVLTGELVCLVVFNQYRKRKDKQKKLNNET